MIVDSSAIVAILTREPGYEALVEKLFAAEVAGIGTPTLCEVAVVLTRRTGPGAVAIVQQFLRAFGIVPVPFSDQHWQAAAEAFARFGKGRHAAALNFGDCMCYAVAKLADEPLLFVGADFSRTDLQAA